MPDVLEELIDLTTRIDRRLSEREGCDEKCGSLPAVLLPLHLHSSSSSSSTSPESVQMLTRQLPPAERRRRMQSDLLRIARQLHQRLSSKDHGFWTGASGKSLFTFFFALSPFKPTLGESCSAEG